MRLREWGGVVKGETSLLARTFYRRDVRIVARELLGCRLVTLIDGERAEGVIIETEAYLSEGDEASHSWRGETARNRSMFLEGGHAYVYRIYGMHSCFNVVAGRKGIGESVLIRAIEPTVGTEIMRQRRGERPDRDLANGPGKLTVALGIGPEHGGLDLMTSTVIWIERGEDLSDDVEVTPRIGIRRSADLLLRWRRRR